MRAKLYIPLIFVCLVQSCDVMRTLHIHSQLVAELMTSWSFQENLKSMNPMSYNNPAKFSNYPHLADERSEAEELLLWVTYLAVEETG